MNMKKCSRTLFGLLMMLILPSIHLFSQNVSAALSRLATNPIEKTYIQFDKEFYVSGETIFFKAYLYTEGKPSALSNNFYLQFTDSRGGIISSKKYPVQGATAKGSIQIPDSLPQGNYFVRAVTPVM